MTIRRHHKPMSAPKVMARFKERVRELTRRTRGVSLEEMVAEQSAYLRGWRGYFGFCQTPRVLMHLDSWIRRRLRSRVAHTSRRFEAVKKLKIANCHPFIFNGLEYAQSPVFDFFHSFFLSGCMRPSVCQRHHSILSMPKIEPPFQK